MFKLVSWRLYVIFWLYGFELLDVFVFVMAFWVCRAGK